MSIASIWATSTATTAVGLAVAFGGGRALEAGRRRLGWPDDEGLVPHNSKWAWTGVLLAFVVLVEG